MFVFRNYTIENLFSEEVSFSGYGDISIIPEDDLYVWFYIAPINLNHRQCNEEIIGIEEKLKLVAERIPGSSKFFILTLENLFPIDIIESDSSIKSSIQRINRFAESLAESMPNIRVIDFNDFLKFHNPKDWTNWKFYFMSQMVLNPSLSEPFKVWWNAQIESLSIPRKKCLVLDLDNTLWDGVLGEDGISGIKMSGDYPGNAFSYFQEGLVELSKTGVILTICSKNNEDDVREVWRKNPFIKLGPDYISAYRINWNNKADNIRELAKELNIGLDSMVFVDDNPSERELVKKELPMVTVPEFPKRPYGLMDFYQNLVNNYFKTYYITKEDIDKTGQYKANALRASEQSRFTNLSDFIKSLGIRIDIMKADEFNIPRIAQMTQKTNQFNLTTRRYTESDILRLIESGHEPFCISVSDKFGDNGITGLIIIKSETGSAIIDSLLLSCRILGKDIETAFVSAIINHLYKNGIRTIKATYVPTLKNGLVADFYDRIGFSCTEVRESGIKEYSISLEKPIEISDSYLISFK